MSAAAAEAALALLEVDGSGLDRLDREILRAICGSFARRPGRARTLAVAVGEERDTIEDVYEPYLLQLGMIKRTRAGGRDGDDARVRAPAPRAAAAPARRCSDLRLRCVV